MATAKPTKASSTSRPRARKRASGGRDILGREAWLDAARQALLRDGIGGVEIGKLARRLGVTRGGFYWFFKSRKQLLDELLATWERASVRQFDDILQRNRHNGMHELQAVVDLWIDEKEYDPAWDAAIRDWARTSSHVAKVVHRVDDQRVAVLRQIFIDMGYSDPEALIRARVTYYHQVGYYELGVRETREERLRLMPYYTRVLTGRAT